MNNAEENKNTQLEVKSLEFFYQIIICSRQEMLTSIKSHSEHVKAVRTNMEEQMKPKAQSIIESIAKKEETSK